MDKRELIIKLYANGIIKFGDFTLKSGVKSNIYFDLRTLIGYPAIMIEISKLIWNEFINNSLQGQLCGVAYTGIPIASWLSMSYCIPQILVRKERKEYGTGQLIEGVWKERDRIVLIDDVITSGSSLEDVAVQLRNVGLVVEDAVVLIDRRTYYTPGTVHVHSVITLEDIEKVLCEHLLNPTLDLERLIIDRRSNLVVAADVSNMGMLHLIARMIGDKIAILKTHVDILEDFTLEGMLELRRLADEKGFLLMEDRKFADIGAILKRQLHEGIYKISSWAHLITAHPIMGRESLKIGDNKTGLVIVAEGSSVGAMTDPGYHERALQIPAEAYVAQNRLQNEIIMTPGVSFKSSGDGAGQQYRSPWEAVKAGATFIIVGRGVTEADDIYAAAEEYRRAGLYSLLAHRR